MTPTNRQEGVHGGFRDPKPVVGRAMDRTRVCLTLLFAPHFWPQPGTVDTNREGVGGGFKELDEAEMAEARRRRQEFENDDSEMCVPCVAC